jgi:two-component system, OmpR family, response regulator
MQKMLTEEEKFSFSPRGKLKKIMFVDDDTELHPIVEKGFKNFYAIDSLLCASGKEAISKVQDFNPNLIILDAMMPEMDGIAVMKELSKNPKTKNIPIIFLTGKDRVVELEEMLALGPIGIILKPIFLKTFAQEVQEIWTES